MTRTEAEEFQTYLTEVHDFKWENGFLILGRIAAYFVFEPANGKVYQFNMGNKSTDIYPEINEVKSLIRYFIKDKPSAFENFYNEF
jgi:hypothetical protein